MCRTQLVPAGCASHLFLGDLFAIGEHEGDRLLCTVANVLVELDNRSTSRRICTQLESVGGWTPSPLATTRPNTHRERRPAMLIQSWLEHDSVLQPSAESAPLS